MNIIKVIFISVFVSQNTFSTISSDLTATDYGTWVLGSTKPVNGKPVVVPSGAPNEDFIELGYASAFYWETTNSSAGEGIVDFWIYDSGIRLDINQTMGNGPYWGLRSVAGDDVLIIGVFRRSYVGGDRGYNVWSSLAQFSPYHFQKGPRASHDAPFTPGWYKWKVNGKISSISFTVYNVRSCEIQDCSGASIQDVTKTFNSNSFSNAWSGLFGFGWNAIAFKGEASGHPEKFNVQIIGGSGIFKDVGASSVEAIKPTEFSTWGNIKRLY